jgi:hypothetical protein
MKNLLFATLILGSAIYTLYLASTEQNPSYGVYAMLFIIGGELFYNKWQEKKNANKT